MGQSKIHIKSGVALTAIAVVLAACDVTAPSVAVPSVGINDGDRFSDGASPAAPSYMENSEWWTTFGSTELNAIVAKMRRDNPDIAAGALRVLQSELNLVTTLSRTPSVSGGASLSSTSMTDLLGDRSVDTSGELSSTVSWEADIWKRIAMQGDSASAMHMATTLDQDALVNSLIANVLRQHISLSFTRRDIAATRRVINTRQASLSPCHSFRPVR